MCDIYHFSEEKVACEYLAYLSHKKYPINQTPSIEILEGFENESLKLLAGKKRDKTIGPVVYNSSTLPQHSPYKGTSCDVDDDDDDGGLTGYYGTSNKTPVHSRQVKRQVSPDSNTIGNKKRIGGHDLNSPAPFSPNISSYKGKKNRLHLSIHGGS